MKLYKYLFGSLLFLIAIELQAQVTVGSGTEPNKAALLDLKTQDASNPTSVTDDSNITTTTGGLLLPRVKLTSLTSLEPFIIGATETDKIKHAGLLVHNINATNMFKQGTYQWDGTQWKLFAMDLEWTYDGTADAEKVYLTRSTLGKNEIGADIYIRKDGSMVNTWGDRSSNNNIYLSIAANENAIKRTSTSSGVLDFQNNYLHIDGSKFANYRGLFTQVALPGDNTASSNATITALEGWAQADNANNTAELKGVSGTAYRGAPNGAGNVDRMFAGSFSAVAHMPVGKVGEITGVLSQASFAGTASADKTYGVRSSLSFNGDGKIDAASLLYGKVDFAGADTEIDVLRGMHLDLSGEIRKVNKAYGIYLDNVAVANDNNSGTVDNYAIYTNKGENRLGDQLSVYTTNDSTDPNTSAYPLRLYNDAWQANQITGIEFYNVAKKGVPSARIYTQLGGKPDAGEYMYFQTQENDIGSAINTKQPTTKMAIDPSGNVGIGVLPDAKLHIVSSSANGFKLVDGNQLAGRVLTSDANGLATWAPPSASSFYMPPFNLSLIAGVGNSATVDLYAVYEQHYKGLSGRFVSSDPSITQVPNVYPREKLAFLVLDYDDSVITVDKIENSVMHYKVNSITPSAFSYLSIICVVKE
ncbi:hypothetical protein M2451_003684 [Dysgonomonas sp. PFB1-18]|uniref:hypothetical protein n=1 Tax=unclassified Dysgonomonas TaxID=2630389 RepID=UPI002476FD40|nr:MULTISPECIES: hypothetical protein [unclassified Dysgonomonas]MDH6310873.1 hypothetical protein [Dysgonomonas sp. PF1-14]MDH6340689.1 hypothetical protein [Dysgonomonas sp. PF1-16]MDH6382343.1 hypothetical protein [Dysgonomonas sp. PFB1-18]MDH6399693.1 hypothetical protein [Dysgonomonas sp. PF1-23]